MTVRELLLMARQVELRVGRLYEHMARVFEQQPELLKLLHTLAQQEQEHARITAEALEASDAPETDLLFDPEVLNHFIDTIDDVEDEVCHRGVDQDGALEILLHMETSVAEKFYERIPEATPGLPERFVNRMVETSRAHVRLIRDFKSRAGRPGEERPA
jgi:rubrerythrin